MMKKGHLGYHTELGPEHLTGNQGLGRVVLCPGSVARCPLIAAHWRDVEIIETARRNDTYLGVYESDGLAIDMAVTATGMGPASTNIIFTELVEVGARLLLRVGSAGAVHPGVDTGDIVIVTGAVRDEDTTRAFAPPSYPALAHPEWVQHLREAALRLGLGDRVYQGICHTKSCLYGREEARGPLAEENLRYIQVLRELGVLCSEMESALFFVQGHAEGPDVSPISVSASGPGVVKTGAILAVIGGAAQVEHGQQAKEAEALAIRVALEAAASLLRRELASR